MMCKLGSNGQASGKLPPLYPCGCDVFFFLSFCILREWVTINHMVRRRFSSKRLSPDFFEVKGFAIYHRSFRSLVWLKICHRHYMSICQVISLVRSWICPVPHSWRACGDRFFGFFSSGSEYRITFGDPCVHRVCVYVGGGG